MAKRTRSVVKKLLAGYFIWLLIGTFVYSVYSFVTGYRNNDLEMVRLRNEVYIADEQGTDIEVPLRNLRDFVTTHMNADLRKGSNTIESEDPIQLVNSYNRAVKAEQDRVSAERTRIAQEAQDECERQFPLPPLSRRAQCVQEYKDARPITEKVIDKSYYTYDFISPVWSPDQAGWSLLAAIGSALILGVLIFAGFVKEEIEN